MDDADGPNVERLPKRQREPDRLTKLTVRCPHGVNTPNGCV